VKALQRGRSGPGPRRQIRRGGLIAQRVLERCPLVPVDVFVSLAGLSFLSSAYPASLVRERYGDRLADLSLRPGRGAVYRCSMRAEPVGERSPALARRAARPGARLHHSPRLSVYEERSTTVLLIGLRSDAKFLEEGLDVFAEACVMLVGGAWRTGAGFG
jgi:hypothetical protein